jgi:3-hydroxyisobutyrate dehydrogenase-like beta-hydroxyacid dehydrogenase
LSDVLAVAILMARNAASAPDLVLMLEGLPSSSRLGLNEARIVSVMRDSALEVKALSEALGD